MRVAVILCGEPRHSLQTCELIKKYIIEPNNADVFMHMWYDSKNLNMEKVAKNRGVNSIPEGIDKKLISFYQPKAYCVEPQKFKQFFNYNCGYYGIPEDMLNNHMSPHHGENNMLTPEEVKLRIIRYTHISQFYSIFKSNLLKEEYSLENNILYDCVIKLRYDCIPNAPLICKNYDMNYLYYQNQGEPDFLVRDWWNMGSNQIMNIYASIFLNLKYLNNYKGFYKKNQRQPVTIYKSDECMLSPEFFIRDIMWKYNIPTKGILYRMNIADHLIQ